VARASLNLFAKRRNAAGSFILSNTFNAPHGKKQIAKTNERLFVYYRAQPIIKCIQVKAAQEYSSLTDLVEQAPTFFAGTVENNYNG